MNLTLSEIFWLMPFVLPIAIWVAWSDLKFMRIPNKAVLVLTIVFLLVGFVALPWDVYLWRLLHLAVVLVIGFILNFFRLVGGGDAKYAAAMAPFFASADVTKALILYAAMLLGAYVSHRIFKWLPFVRRMTPDWKSWDTGKDFPMGLALSGTLIIYYVIGAVGYL